LLNPVDVFTKSAPASLSTSIYKKFISPAYFTLSRRRVRHSLQQRHRVDHETRRFAAASRQLQLFEILAITGKPRHTRYFKKSQ
jgi:hypothetical protein